jgi:hypothetical protein
VSFHEQVRAATDRVLTDLRSHFESDLLRYTGEVTRAAATERARASAGAAPAGLGGQPLPLEEFVEAVRALDTARSLADVLDQLMHFAAGEVDRAAVLMVKGDTLQEWRSVGFVGPLAPAGALTFDQAGLAGSVARSGVPTSRPAGPASDNRPPSASAFGSTGEPRHAVALPVTVAGAVVGVLYADAPTTGSAPDLSWWPAILEVFTRHASRVLEVMTIQRVSGLSSIQPVAQASQSTSSAEPPPRNLQ